MEATAKERAYVPEMFVFELLRPSTHKSKCVIHDQSTDGIAEGLFNWELLPACTLIAAACEKCEDEPEHEKSFQNSWIMIIAIRREIVQSGN